MNLSGRGERAPERPDSPWIERAINGGVIVLVSGSWLASFVAELYVTGRSGVSMPWALVYPLSADGLQAVAMGAAYRLRRHPWYVRTYAWGVVGASALIGLLANGLHGPLNLGLINWPWWAAGAWAAMPGWSFFQGLHLAYTMWRRHERPAAVVRFQRRPPVQVERQEARLPAAPERRESAPVPPTPVRRRPARPRLPAPRTHVGRLITEIATERGIKPAQVEAGDVAERLGFPRGHSSVRRWVSTAKATFPGRSGIAA